MMNKLSNYLYEKNDNSFFRDFINELNELFFYQFFRFSESSIKIIRIVGKKV